LDAGRQALIYNSNGHLYRLDLAKNTPELINSGLATNNNNDHVLSFDGKMLGISNHVKEDGNSSNSFCPAHTRRRTYEDYKTGPSYLHGWSPDRKFLIYTDNVMVNSISIKFQRVEERNYV